MARTLEVKTRLGLVKGNIIPSSSGFPIYSFQGIPYAKPPVGALRFKNPVPIEPWTEVLDATKAPPVAPQLGFDKTQLFPTCSEDCLYLNVYLPKSPDSRLKLPVMVWIHGGAFQRGCGNRNFVGPEYLVPEGVILVAVNYRLGALGFLSFENAECSGNFGLKDQNLALIWVRDNIREFGGDPDSVTLFGQSAGGASVHHQVISLKSRGLFHRAIAMSGSALNFWATDKNAVSKGLLLAKRLGCDTRDPSEALKTIKKASLKDICLKSDGITEELEGTWDLMGLLSFTFLPVVEPKELPGAFITKAPEQAVADGDYADIPFITGVTGCEGAYFLTPPTFVPKYTTDEDYQRMLPRGLKAPLNSKNSIAAAKKLKTFYFPKGNTQDGFLKAMSAIMFTHGIYRTARLHLDDSKKISPHFLYVFDITRHPAPLRAMVGTSDVPGTAHTDELDYLFHPNHLIPGSISRGPVEPGTKDGKAKALITKLWTDFAKTGVPGAEWHPANSKHLRYVKITDVLEKKSGFFAEEMKLWDEIYDLMKK